MRTLSMKSPLSGRMSRLAASLLYAALVGAFFVGYYVDVRRAPPHAIVDYTPAVVLLAVVTVVPGLLIGRWWAVGLPLVAFPAAALMMVIAAFYDGYSDIASERGGVVGLDWFGVAALVCFYAVPAAAFGAGLRAWGRMWERRWE